MSFQKFIKKINIQRTSSIISLIKCPSRFSISTYCTINLNKLFFKRFAWFLFSSSLIFSIIFKLWRLFSEIERNSLETVFRACKLDFMSFECIQISTKTTTYHSLLIFFFENIFSQVSPVVLVSLLAFKTLNLTSSPTTIQSQSPTWANNKRGSQTKSYFSSNQEASMLSDKI